MTAFAIIGPDPAPVIIGWIFAAPYALMAVIAIVGAWDRKPRPRSEGFSERHDRLDAEAVTTPDFDGNVAWFDGRGVTR